MSHTHTHTHTQTHTHCAHTHIHTQTQTHVYGHTQMSSHLLPIEDNKSKVCLSVSVKEKACVSFRNVMRMILGFYIFSKDVNFHNHRPIHIPINTILNMNVLYYGSYFSMVFIILRTWVLASTRSKFMVHPPFSSSCVMFASTIGSNYRQTHTLLSQVSI